MGYKINDYFKKTVDVATAVVKSPSMLVNTALVSMHLLDSPIKNYHIKYKKKDVYRHMLGVK